MWGSFFSSELQQVYLEIHLNLIDQTLIHQTIFSQEMQLKVIFCTVNKIRQIKTTRLQRQKIKAEKIKAPSYKNETRNGHFRSCTCSTAH